mmetsp:Transcript_19280/g.58147  ORF Transcript_19280/g.58147 Transcript_19280/m.58147 type:complete len:219 (+) Transcript_19280:1340-1996(+)
MFIGLFEVGLAQPCLAGQHVVLVDGEFFEVGAVVDKIHLLAARVDGPQPYVLGQIGRRVIVHQHAMRRLTGQGERLAVLATPCDSLRRGWGLAPKEHGRRVADNGECEERGANEECNCRGRAAVNRVPLEAVAVGTGHVLQQKGLDAALQLDLGAGILSEHRLPDVVVRAPEAPRERSLGLMRRPAVQMAQVARERARRHLARKLSEPLAVPIEDGED